MDERVKKLPKWAQDEIAALESRISHLEAEISLHENHPEIPPDVPPPSGESLSVGWWAALRYCGDNTFSVQPACSSKTSHAIGQTDETTSYGSRHLWSSPELALRALLPQLTNEYREKMRNLLGKIAKCRQESSI